MLGAFASALLSCVGPRIFFNRLTGKAVNDEWMRVPFRPLINFATRSIHALRLAPCVVVFNGVAVPLLVRVAFGRGAHVFDLFDDLTA